LIKNSVKIGKHFIKTDLNINNWIILILKSKFYLEMHKGPNTALEKVENLIKISNNKYKNNLMPENKYKKNNKYNEKTKLNYKRRKSNNNK
jgi:hypothetical protein